MSKTIPPYLPTDVIRKVICYTFHSIEEMQLVSHLWNNLVHQEFNAPLDQLPMEELQLNAIEFNYHVIETQWWTRVFSFKLRDLLDNGFVVTMRRDSDGMICIAKTLSIPDIIKETEKKKIKRLNRICLHEMSIHDMEYYLPEIFKDYQADEIAVMDGYFEDNYSDAILDLIRSCNSVRAYLNIDQSPSLGVLRANAIGNAIAMQVNPANQPIRYFLLEISELVDELHIKQIHNGPEAEFLLTDDLDAPMPREWYEFLIEMFGKRVSKIVIEHNNKAIKGHVSVLKYLMGKLSRIGNKQPWLKFGAYRDGLLHLKNSEGDLRSSVTFPRTWTKKAANDEVDFTVTIKHS